MRSIPALIALTGFLTACGPAPEDAPESVSAETPIAEPTFLSLSDRFASARVENPTPASSTETTRAPSDRTNIRIPVPPKN